MKKYLLLSLMTLTSVLALGAPGETVQASDATINVGQTSTTVISLNNSGSYVSFQMDLTLPDGVTINKDGCSLTSRVTDPDKELVIGKQSDNVYRLTYTSFALTPISGTSGALINLSLSASAESSGGQAKLSNIRFVTANSDRITMSDALFTINVVKQAATVVTPPTANTLTYTGSAQELINAGVASGGTMQYSLDGTTYGTAIPTGTNAGSYTVYYKVVGDANHSDTNPATVSVTIGKAAASFTAAPSAKTLTYTGSAQELVNAGAAIGGTMQYSLDGTTYGTGIPTGTNAGSYTVYYKVVGDANHSDTNPATVSVTIGKAAASFTAAPSAKTLTYTGSAQELVNAGAAIGGTMQYSLDGTTYGTAIPTGTNAGSYTVYYKVVGDANHSDTNPATVSVTIGKAPLTISGGTYTMKQGDALPTFTASYEGFVNNETEAVLTTKPTLTTTATSASAPGTYAVNVSGANAQNYAITYKAGTLTIVEADAIAVIVKDASREYGDANPAFEYEISGGTVEQLGGTPELTCEAVATSAVGEYAIKASKGTATYPNIVFVNGTLTVTKAPLTINGGSYTMKQGDNLPAFTPTYSGFKNNETEAVLTTKPKLSTTATSASDPGKYAVTVSGAEAQNYAITYEAGTLTITEADGVTLTAKSYTIKYGDALPEFEFTSEGAALDGTPSINCEATSASPVGTYPIVITKGSVTNYNAHYVNGTLTIEKAPLTISGGNYTINQGEALPTFTPTYTGFKNNETEAVLTTKPTLTTTATSASAPGTYAVTVSGAEAQNYAITYEAGTLTIVEIDAIAIIVNNASREYGDENPAFEYEIRGGTEEQLGGAPELTCEAVATSAVGEYAIKASKGTATYPNIVFINGTLTIEKAPLTISAGTYTMKQGDNLPAFTPTYSGFKNNETEAVLTTKPKLTTTATSASAPGKYAVNVSGAKAQNYAITYKAGTLTIVEADAITLTAKSYTITYGDALPEFEFTSEGAALDGTPSISCEATSASPVGTYPIVITKGSVTNYNARYVNGTLTIEKAPLTISGGNYTINQGEALPTFTPTYSGFKNNETEAVLTTKPTLTTTATSASAPGTYAVTVSGAEAQNYAITYEAGTLTIVEIDAIAVIVKNASREYGDENPAFEYEIRGGTVEQLGGTPELTCEAVATSAVGEYDIKASKGTATYPNIVFINGTLTIEKAPLTISAGTYTMKQGEALPTFAVTYTGFKNNETASVLTTQPIISTTATSASAPGTYEINVSGAESRNYEITYEAGTLTIIEAHAITVIVKNASREYGDENPVFEYEIRGGTEEQLGGTPELTCEAVATSAVGEYEIKAARGTVTYLNIVFVDGTLTITKAPLTISGGTYTMKQGEDLPAFTATYSGFKNGETEEVLTAKPTLTTTATSASEPGEYEVTVSGAEAVNYEITYEAGTLTITEVSGIQTYFNENDNVNDSWYTIDGRKLQGKPTQKGVYIRNGAKVVIK